MVPCACVPVRIRTITVDGWLSAVVVPSFYIEPRLSKSSNEEPISGKRKWQTQKERHIQHHFTDQHALSIVEVKMCTEPQPSPISGNLRHAARLSHVDPWQPRVHANDVNVARGCCGHVVFVHSSSASQKTCATCLSGSCCIRKLHNIL